MSEKKIGCISDSRDFLLYKSRKVPAANHKEHIFSILAVLQSAQSHDGEGSADICFDGGSGFKTSPEAFLYSLTFFSVLPQNSLGSTLN